MTTRAQQQEQAPQLAIDIVSNDVEKIIHECGVTALKGQPAFIQAVSMARGLRELRKILTNQFIEETFMPLMGTPLGFITDKDKEPLKERYGVEVVRDCVIEALLRGFRPVGNEFNIIAGRFYGAKSGYERNVNEFPGVSDVRLELGVPHLSDKGALVPVEASWLYHGREERLECIVKKITTEGGEKIFDTRIPVKVNSGMGSDAILGKAQRKMYARIYQRLTGCSKELIESEDEAADTITTTGTALPEASADGRRISNAAARGSRRSREREDGRSHHARTWSGRLTGRGAPMNYDGLPEALRGGVRRYIEDGIIPGGFLQAVISNDLREAVTRADPFNRAAIVQIVEWFVRNAPIAPVPCWGSREVMTAWAAAHAEFRAERDGKR